MSPVRSSCRELSLGRLLGGITIMWKLGRNLQGPPSGWIRRATFWRTEEIACQVAVQESGPRLVKGERPTQMNGRLDRVHPSVQGVSVLWMKGIVSGKGRRWGVPATGRVGDDDRMKYLINLPIRRLLHIRFACMPSDYGSSFSRLFDEDSHSYYNILFADSIRRFSNEQDKRNSTGLAFTPSQYSYTSVLYMTSSVPYSKINENPATHIRFPYIG